MTLKKKDLYNFIDDRRNDKWREIRERYVDKAKEIGSVVYNLLRVDIQNFNARFVELKAEYENLKENEVVKIENDYYVKQFFYHDRRLYENQLLQRFTCLSHMTYNSDTIPKQLKKHIQDYNKLVVKFVEETDEVEKLHKELQSVIRNETNAKRAKKTLEGLGLDLSDLKADEPCYPVIVKPSVDVKLFNNPNM